MVDQGIQNGAVWRMRQLNVPPIVDCAVYFLGGIFIATLFTLMIGDSTGNSQRFAYLQLAMAGTIFWFVFLIRPFLLRWPWLGLLGPFLIYGVIAFLCHLPVWIGIPLT